MLKIRLQRYGRTNSPAYRVVLVNHTDSVKTGKFLEILGDVNPIAHKRTFNVERIKYWMSVGAQLTPTIHNMFLKDGHIAGKKMINAKHPKKKEEPAQAAAPTATPAATPTEEPAADPTPATAG